MTLPVVRAWIPLAAPFSARAAYWQSPGCDQRLAGLSGLQAGGELGHDFRGWL
jgi:hypothetical protein